MAGHPMFVPRGARKRLLALSELIRLQLKAEEDKAKTVMAVREGGREGVGEEEKAVVDESTSSLLVEIVLFRPTYGTRKGVLFVFLGHAHLLSDGALLGWHGGLCSEF